jgi:methylmalonyl-CoA/ethylmalonyl-CoA epimerase
MLSTGWPRTLRRMTTERNIVIAQIGVVVRDLRAAMEAYRRTCGWEPWRIYELTEPLHSDTSVRGDPVAYSMRVGVTSAGGVDFELIQPLDGPSQYKEFLEEKGEGLHHVLLRDGDGGPLDAASLGLPALMAGRVGDASYAYLDGQAELKTIVEVVNGAVQPTGVYP